MKEAPTWRRREHRAKWLLGIVAVASCGLLVAWLWSRNPDARSAAGAPSAPSASPLEAATGSTTDASADATRLPLGSPEVESTVVRVVVLGAAGELVPGAEVTIEGVPRRKPFAAEPDAQLLASGETAADGVCDLAFTLPPGHATRVVAGHRGLRATVAFGLAPHAPVVVVLQPAGSLDIRVLDARGSTLAGIELGADYPRLDGDSIDDGEAELGVSDARGVVTVSGADWMTRIVPRDGRRVFSVRAKCLAAQQPLIVDSGDLRGEAVLQFEPHCAMQIEVAGLPETGQADSYAFSIMAKDRLGTLRVERLDSSHRVRVDHVALGSVLAWSVYPLWMGAPLQWPQQIVAPSQAFITETVRVAIRPQPFLLAKVEGAGPGAVVDVVLRAGEREWSESLALVDRGLLVPVPEHLDGALVEAVDVRCGGAVGSALLAAPLRMVPGQHDLGVIKLAAEQVVAESTVAEATELHVPQPRRRKPENPEPESVVVLTLQNVDPDVVPALGFSLHRDGGSSKDDDADSDADVFRVRRSYELQMAAARTLSCAWTGVPDGAYRLHVDCVGRGTVATRDVVVRHSNGKATWLEHKLDGGLRAVRIAVLRPIGPVAYGNAREVRVRIGDAWTTASLVGDKATVSWRDAFEGIVRVAGYRDESFAVGACQDIGPIAMRPGIPVEVRIRGEHADLVGTHLELVEDGTGWRVGSKSPEPGLFVAAVPAPGNYTLELRGGRANDYMPLSVNDGEITVAEAGGTWERRVSK